MKLSLSQLERARRHPKAFAAAQLSKFRGIRPTFFGYWVFAAKLYHKLLKANDPRALQKAQDYLLEHCRAKLSSDDDFDEKIALYSKRLGEYIASHATLQQPTIQTNKRIEFSGVAGHTISGVIGRLDIIPGGGFAATNFELRPTNWQDHLRTAITQRTLANDLGRSPSKIQVGMYCLEMRSHDYVSLSDNQIEKSITESARVLNTVDAELKVLKRAKA